MTKHFNTIGNFYRPSSLGFERILNDIERVFNDVEKPVTNTYPPHNIIKADENKYVIELAIAGFTRDDIDITVNDGNLIIKGSRKDSENDKLQYLHRGIGGRTFSKVIQIADTIEVRGAEYTDGILRIALENIIPEHKKPRKIEIGTIKDLVPELLVE